MTEQCHHYSSTTGQRCTNKAVVKVTEGKYWQTYACSEHRVLYEEHYRSMYKVQPVK